MRVLLFFLLACLARGDGPRPIVSGEAEAAALRTRYLALTGGWAREAVLKRAEQEAAENGRRWEKLMTTGLDDPLAKKISAAGEPSFAALSASYPGKVLDRTVLGTWSDPRKHDGFQETLRGVSTSHNEEFVLWWNGAISADLRKGRLSGAVQPVAANTNILFRAGRDAEMFGRVGERYSRIAYEDGYLPITTATYEHDGVRYRQTALADNPVEEAAGADIAYVRFDLANTANTDRAAELHADIILIDTKQLSHSGQRVMDPGDAVLLVHSDRRAVFDTARGRLTHRVELKPGGTASIFFKIPYWPDSKGLTHRATRDDFEAAHQRVRNFWTGLLSSGVRISVPEERVNNVWRALLAQNFILADGPRFTYGSGLRYNDSYYPQENGFGAHTFALYGFKDYANALLPYNVPVSVRRDLAARKYQNRRAMPLHHLLENYRLTGKLDVFERHKEEFYRVAEEIISDRRKTMTGGRGPRPLHWGLLPPDRPGVDLRASTQTVYVLGHNITNCQGLQDFGEFLSRTGIDPERGARYLREAAEYRKTLLDTMQRAAIRVPGRAPFVDLQTLYFRETPEYGPGPYDDLAMGRVQGTYYHYWADMQFQYNFFNPGDRVGQWIADYVAQRGGFVLGCTRARARPNQPYGWINNVYNSGYYNYRLRSGRVDEFLLGFYSRLAFGMTRHAWVASEGSPFIGYNTENGGFTSADDTFPNSAANAETLSMLRSMLVLEELKDNVETGDIYLLRGAPRAWFEDGKRIEAERVPTYFGDLSLAVESGVARRAIRVVVKPPAARPYESILLSLRHPQSLPIRSVRVNGAAHGAFDAAKGFVRLAHGPQEFVIDVSY